METVAASLFDPIRLRGVTARNRVWVSPMCQYTARDGMPGDWHLVHLGSRAVGGAGLVMAEASAVVPEGRISPADTGIWSDAQAEAWGRIAHFIEEQGAVPAIQLAHAGRKASTAPPWDGGGPVAPDAGGWPVVGPSAVAFSPEHPVPAALDADSISEVVAAFAAGATRSLAAGFRAVEIHMAHGYLLHQFLSPLSNLRDDAWGGSFEGRTRLPIQVVRAVRARWPEELPLLVRVSATDWADGGWDLEQTIELARLLQTEGVDLIDCSSGGLVPHAAIPVAPGFQVPLSAAIRETGIATGAVGLLTAPAQAAQVIATGQADVVLLARQLLRDPYWPLHAARSLGVDVAWPAQYGRAR